MRHDTITMNSKIADCAKEERCSVGPLVLLLPLSMLLKTLSSCHFSLRLPVLLLASSNHATVCWKNHDKISKLKSRCGIYGEQDTLVACTCMVFYETNQFFPFFFVSHDFRN